MFKKNKKQKNDKKQKKQSKKKQENTPDEIIDENLISLDSLTDLDESVLKRGGVSLLDLALASGIDRSNEDFIRVGSKYVRNFMLMGFPKHIHVGWIDKLIHSDDDMDVMIHIEPADERTAIDELTKKITQFESQLSIELENGSNRNITRLRNAIQDLYDEREKIEQSYVNLFYIQIGCNLYAPDLETLNKKAQLLDNDLLGRKIKLVPTYLQQDLGYKSCLPFGKSYLKTMYRNFSSEALTACFPFYNNEISHKNGTYIGVNLNTGTPIYLDFFNRRLLSNGNITIFGRAGSGKTFFVTLFISRQCLEGKRPVMIDPEGDYRKITKGLGGSVIDIAPNSNNFINAFDLEDEDILDEDGVPTGRRTVKIKEKISDLLNLIGVMARGMDSELTALVSKVLFDLYDSFGFTENPDSLYETDMIYDAEKDELVQGGIKKTMPIFSDFWNNLNAYAQEINHEGLKSLVNTLSMFKKGGVYDLFDCYTSPELTNFKDSPIITFDISQLEEDTLRPIGMYIAMSWTWEKFCKKNPYQQKIVGVDEAWMMTSQSMAGSEFTSKFLENCSRRIRKRNGLLLIASQNYREFAESAQGKAVLSNAAINVFFRQADVDIDSIQETFKLSDGEADFMHTAHRGEFLLRLAGNSTIGYASSFEFERELIERKSLAASEQNSIYDGEESIV